MKNKSHIFIYLILIFIMLAPFIDTRLFLLDFTSKLNSDQSLDLFYGKMTPEYGGSFPVILMTIIFKNILILFILILCIYSMYNFINSVSQLKSVQFFACILYLINPYVYIRILTGQLFLLFSYAILPFLLKTFIDLLDNKDRKEMIKFTFFLSLVAFNIHILVISLIVMGIIFLFWFNKHGDIRISKILLTTTILFTLLNSYWIIPVLTAKNTVVANIGNKDFEVFAPKGGLFDIASMHGFWLEGYLYSRDFLPGWQILYLIILSLTILGFIYYYKDQKIGIYVKAFAMIGILGFILASGVNGPFGEIVRWLFDNTLLKGFRDSQKFVAMLVLVYSVLGGLGLNKIKNVYDKYKQDEEMP